MKPQKQQSEQPTLKALLANRRFEELSDAEKAQYGQINQRDAQATVQRIVNNLNQRTATR